MNGKHALPEGQSRPPKMIGLTEAQTVFRNLAGEMRAFANAEILADWFVKKRGYDADEIASSLIGYSNEVSTYGENRNY